jgi:hypothetical protein
MQAAAQEVAVKESPFVHVMGIWVRWVSLKDFAHTTGDSNLQDMKEFFKAGEAVEGMINDLPRRLWWAIRKCKGISTAWLFPNHPLQAAITEAEQILLPKMKNHIATRRYFS